MAVRFGPAGHGGLRRCRLNGKRCILHSDLNNFYASVECLRRPEFWNKPLAVCGSFEDRHGVVLAKNMPAKQMGVKTGEVFWQAKQKCPELVSVPADFPAYIKVSRAVRAIYERFTDRIEPFGIDECWLDVTESRFLFGDAREIAECIRAAVKREIGVTVSVGVSWNKIFAKLASDLKKPDAVTVIDEQNYRNVVWRLPVSNLLYVGKATAKRLLQLGIGTIGDLARADEAMLTANLGKWGKVLHTYANGEDASEVLPGDRPHVVKSVGNSLTCYRDLTSPEEVHTLLLLLSESVSARLTEKGLGRAETVKISVTDNAFRVYGKQGKPRVPVSSAKGIADCAFALFTSLYSWRAPVRALGVSVCDFTVAEQLDLFGNDRQEEKSAKADAAVLRLREKYGSGIVQRAAVFQDARLKNIDIKGTHLIRPASPDAPDEE